jgi:hypothetical protein
VFAGDTPRFDRSLRALVRLKVARPGEPDARLFTY